jgi:hypothetical protein
VMVRGRRATWLSVKIEMGLHATGEHVQFRVTSSPEGSHQTAAGLGGGLDIYAASSATRGMERALESVTCEFSLPGSFSPLDPNALCRNVN